MTEQPELRANETLADLLDHAKDRLGVSSGRALAARAEADGFDLTHTQINYLLKGTYKHEPTRKTIEAIAHLAGVSVERTLVAAGLPVYGPPFRDEIPAEADLLTPRQRAAVLATIREMAFANRRVHDHIRVSHPAMTYALTNSPLIGPYAVLGSLDSSQKAAGAGTEEGLSRSPRRPRAVDDLDLYEPIAAYGTTEPTSAELRERDDDEDEMLRIDEERRRQDESDGA